MHFVLLFPRVLLSVSGGFLLFFALSIFHTFSYVRWSQHHQPLVWILLIFSMHFCAQKEQLAALFVQNRLRVADTSAQLELKLSLFWVEAVLLLGFSRLMLTCPLCYLIGESQNVACVRRNVFSAFIVAPRKLAMF